MRVILLALVAFLGYGQYWLLESNFKNQALPIILHIVGTILWIAAASILFFSFLRVGTTSDGQLCFNPNNPYWKLMRKFWGDAWGDRISLCKSYWLTVAFVAASSYISAMAGVMLYGLTKLAFEIAKAPAKFGKEARASVPALGWFVVIAVLLVLVVLFCIWATKKLPALKYLWYGILGVFVAGMLVAFPIFLIVDYQRITVSAASLIYLKWAGIVVGVMALAALVIVAAFKYLPAIRNTWLGQLLKAAEGELCPILVACPLPCGTETSDPATT